MSSNETQLEAQKNGLETVGNQEQVHVDTVISNVLMQFNSVNTMVIEMCNALRAALIKNEELIKEINKLNNKE